MKLGTKLTVGFGIVIAIMAALGVTSYITFIRIGDNVTALNQRTLPQVRETSGVEKATLEANLLEHAYLASQSNALRADAEKGLENLLKTVDSVKGIAQKTGNVGLEARANEMRKDVEAYGQSLQGAGQALEKNRNEEKMMAERGAVVEKETAALLQVKQAESRSAIAALSVANAINALVLQIRMREKAYLMEQNVQEFASIERDLTQFENYLNDLEKLSADPMEKQQIQMIKDAASEYKKALHSWKQEKESGSEAQNLDVDKLNELVKTMTRAGDTVSQLVDDYILPKQGAVERIDQSRSLIRDVREAALSARMEEHAYILRRDPERLKALMKLLETMEGSYKGLADLAVTDEDKKRIQRASEATKEYGKAVLSWVENDHAVQNTIIPRMRESGNRLASAARALQKEAWEDADRVSSATLGILGKSTNIILLALCVGVALGFLLAFFITRSITKPIRRIIAGLNDGAEQVASASTQVSSASQSLAEGASEQAASIEETSSSLEEMSSMTKQNAENANQAKSRMAEARDIVSKVNGHMNDMNAAIKEITKSSEETGKIIKTIDEIAFQTNLLALNAAVEAARAGEAGAGFAVVADEVRNLAMRAAEAAKNTANLIEKTIKSVKMGNDLTEATQEAYKANVEISGKVGELVDEIAAASAEQAQGIEQLNTAVTEMDKVTQQNAANAEESASASEQMNAQADEMKAMVQELVTLVGGSSARTQAGNGVLLEAPVHTALAKVPVKSKALTTGKGQVTAVARREVRPDQVIPLGKEELKDF